MLLVVCNCSGSNLSQSIVYYSYSILPPCNYLKVRADTYKKFKHTRPIQNRPQRHKGVVEISCRKNNLNGKAFEVVRRAPSWDCPKLTRSQKNDGNIDFKIITLHAFFVRHVSHLNSSTIQKVNNKCCTTVVSTCLVSLTK